MGIVTTIEISKYEDGNEVWLECIFEVQISKYEDEIKYEEWLKML